MTGLTGVIETGKRFVGLEMFVVRPEIVGRVPRLDHRVEVKRLKGSPRPSGTAEGNVRVESPDLGRRFRHVVHGDVEQAFFRPRHCRGAQRNMRHPIRRHVRQFIAARAIDALGQNNMDVGLSEP